ncbi:MAG: polysaccharide biosynthesis protein [Acidimicrobiales bacterium]
MAGFWQLTGRDVGGTSSFATARRRLWIKCLARIRVDLPIAIIDGMMVTASFVALLAIRFEGHIPPTYSERMFEFVPVVVAIHLLANLVWGLYGQIWRHASVAEARRVVFAGLTAGAVIFMVNPMREFPVPRSVALFGAIVATMFIGLVRFQHRLFSWRRKIDRSASRVAVVGAGSAGAAIVREMKRSTDTGLTPVVVIDDDVRKQGRSLLGVPVVGHIATLDRVVERYHADEVLVAVPSADQQLMREVMRGAELAKVPLKVLPPVRELIHGRPSVRDARDLRIEDLLGRQQVTTDLDAIRESVAGRRVLVTGAGGSIGAEIAAQLAAFEPSRLVLLDHDETHLHDAVARLGPASGAEQALADIRERGRLFSLFESVRPELVFHSAALKHVPLLESHVVEAVRTNVLGTLNVVDAAATHEVDQLVFISSDKAVRPENVLGRSKWLGEQLTLLSAPPGARWCAVRFGNVVGSRGSVIPTFALQIANGGPVTVTDPRMNRFFMSVHEAVQLVLQAAVLSDGGEIFMLDMGEPVSILELAERMVRLSGHLVGSEISIRFTGTRPGEKLSEDLRDPEEHTSPTPHPSILRLGRLAVPADRLFDGVGELIRLADHGRDDAAGRVLADLTNGRDDLPDHLDVPAMEQSR